MSHDYYRNKVAIITGAASGIGAALAKHLGELGSYVVVADRQEALAEQVAEAIRSQGGSAVASVLDVRQPDAVQRVVADTLTRWGRIDLFFNNAGIAVGGDVAEYSLADWNDVLDVNLHGVIHGIQAVYPVMVRQGSGHIINTASIAGLAVSVGQTSYAASKHAVVGLSKSLRLEGKYYGVRVSVLCPGAIDTPILHGGQYGRLRLEKAARAELAKMWKKLRPMPAETLAAKVATAVARNDAFIIYPSWWRLIWYLERISPALTSKICELSFARLAKVIEAERQSAAVTTPAATNGHKTADV